MIEFADDFNRANGLVGNGWTSQAQYGGRILDNQLTTLLSRPCYRSPFGAGNTFLLRSDLSSTTLNGHRSSLIFKYDPVTGDRLQLNYANGAVAQSCSLLKYTGGTGVILASVQWAPAVTGYHTVEVRYQNGAITVFVDGVSRLTHTDTSYQDHTQLGYWLPDNTTRSDNFYCTDTWGEALDVTPEPIVQMAEPQGLEFIGTGTAWTPGTPGDPTFTVDKGSLSEQTIDSPTHARATYTPPQADDSALFTDPSTGQTDAVALSTGFQVQTAPPLSEEAVALLNRTGAEGLDPLILLLNYAAAIGGYSPEISLANQIIELYKMLRTSSGEPPAQAPAMSQLDGIWWILNGHVAADPDNNVLDGIIQMMPDVANTDTNVTAIRTDALLTLQSILDAMPADVTAALAAIQADLDAIRTPYQYTLGTVEAHLDAITASYLTWIYADGQYTKAIRTPFDWHLGHVKDWIEAVRGEGLPTIRDVLNAIAGELDVDLQPVLDAIAAVRGADSVDLTQLHDQTNQLSMDMVNLAAQIRGAIAAVRGPDMHDLTEIYHAILDLPQTQVDLAPVLTAISNLSTQLTNSTNQIRADIAALRPADYPIWPGLANVTLGEPVQFGADLRLSGPMDGVLLTVDVANVSQRAWQVEGKSYWKWTGYLAFESDNGDLEPAQWLGQSPAVFVPKAMLTASACVVHLSAGVQATIRPWSYTP